MFKKATKEKSKIKLAIYGIPGSGKTYSALTMATGLGEKIALIDTEYGRASKYSHKFKFDTHIEEMPTIDNMIKAINNAVDYDVLIIDSLSHSWQELLLSVENLAQSRFKGNSWAAWSKGTPKQMELVKSILKFPGHVICTMRSKIEWVLEGKKPIKVGTDPIAGKGIEYEYDVVMEINQDHMAFFSKDITELYQDKTITKPGKEVGAALLKWCNSGKEKEIVPNSTISDKEEKEQAPSSIEKKKEQVEEAIPLTWDDLADLFDQNNEGRKARTLDMNSIWEWGKKQPYTYYNEKTDLLYLKKEKNIDFKGIKEDLPEKDYPKQDFEFGEDGKAKLKENTYLELIDACSTIEELQDVWKTICDNKGCLGYGVKLLELEVAKNEKKKELTNAV